MTPRESNWKRVVERTNYIVNWKQGEKYDIDFTDSSFRDRMWANGLPLPYCPYFDTTNTIVVTHSSGKYDPLGAQINRMSSLAGRRWWSVKPELIRLWFYQVTFTIGRGEGIWVVSDHPGSVRNRFDCNNGHCELLNELCIPHFWMWQLLKSSACHRLNFAWKMTFVGSDFPITLNELRVSFARGRSSPTFDNEKAVFFSLSFFNYCP